MVFCGINCGFNIASDIQYSATVGAALEASNHHIHTIAFSESHEGTHEVTDKYIEQLAEELIDKPLGRNEIWNVNFPGCTLEECKGIRYDTVVSQDDFYAGRPALTVNNFGRGKSYYIASRNEERFNDMFYGKLIKELGLKKVINTQLPHGVTAQMRTDGANDYVFIMNFTQEEKVIGLDDRDYFDLVADKIIEGEIKLPGYGVKILKRKQVL